MSLDQTKIGEAAARLMDGLDEDQREGRLPENVEIVDALVIVELAYKDEDGDQSSAVHVQVHSKRNVVGLGLIQRGHEALTNPDDD